MDSVKESKIIASRAGVIMLQNTSITLISVVYAPEPVVRGTFRLNAFLIVVPVTAVISDLAGYLIILTTVVIHTANTLKPFSPHVELKNISIAK
jgi:hypothetical protein